MAESNAAGRFQNIWISSSLCEKLQNYNVGKFTSSKQIFAEYIIFFVVHGDKSLKKNIVS